MRDQRFQIRSKTLDLRGPIGQERCGRDEDTRLRRTLAFQDQQQREHLDGFAEPHVVRQACSQSQLRQQIEPADTHLLIRTQHCP